MRNVVLLGCLALPSPAWAGGHGFTADGAGLSRLAAAAVEAQRANDKAAFTALYAPVAAGAGALEFEEARRRGFQWSGVTYLGVYDEASGLEIPPNASAADLLTVARSRAICAVVQPSAEDVERMHAAMVVQAKPYGVDATVYFPYAKQCFHLKLQATEGGTLLLTRMAGQSRTLGSGASFYTADERREAVAALAEALLVRVEEYAKEQHEYPSGLTKPVPGRNAVVKSFAYDDSDVSSNTGKLSYTLGEDEIRVTSVGPDGRPGTADDVVFSRKRVAVE